MLYLIAEAIAMRREIVGSNGEECEDVLALRVAGDGAHDAGGGLAHRNARSDDGSTGWVRDFSCHGCGIHLG
jgi:hypothetical protein